MSTETKLDKGLKLCNLRVICVLLIQSSDFRCLYRVYTSDGAFTDFYGYDALPLSIQEWLKARNAWEYTIPGALVVSGVKVV